MALSEVDLGGPWPEGWTPDTPSKNGLAVMRDVYHASDGRLVRRSGKADRYDNPTYAGNDCTTSRGAIYEPGIGHLVSATASQAMFAQRKEGTTSWLTGAAPSSSTGQDLLSASSPPSGYSTTSVDKQIFVASTSAVGYLPIFKWAGSNKAQYDTGTVATTSGTATITGTGTSWSSNVEPGMYLNIEDSGSLMDERCFRIVSVASDTSLTVDQAPDATLSGESYSINSLGVVSSGGDGSWSYRAHMRAGLVCGHQQRLFCTTPFDDLLGTVSYPRFPDRIRWSGLPNEVNGKYIGTDYWQEEAYLDVAPGEGGAIMGMASLGGQLVIMKQAGLYSLNGSVASDGSDNGQFLSTVRRGIGLAHEMAWANSMLGIAFLNKDGLFVYDGAQIRNLMGGKCARYWRNRIIPSVGVAYWWVSAVNDRIILTDSTSSSSMRTHLVYHIGSDTWSTQYGPAMGKVVADTSYGYEPCFMRHSSNANVVFDWASDYDETQRTNYRDASVSGSNVPMITTHPVMLPTSMNGRPVSAFVDGFVNDVAGASSPTLGVKVYSGPTTTASNGWGATFDAASSASTIAKTSASSNHRIRVSVPRVGSSVAVQVYQGDGASTPGDADYLSVNRASVTFAPVRRVAT